MTVRSQIAKTESSYIRKGRKVREEKRDGFVFSRFLRADVFAFTFAWCRNESNNSPQMNANEREFSAFHLRFLRFLRTDAFASAALIGVSA